MEPELPGRPDFSHWRRDIQSRREAGLSVLVHDHSGMSSPRFSSSWYACFTNFPSSSPFVNSITVCSTLRSTSIPVIFPAYLPSLLLTLAAAPSLCCTAGSQCTADAIQGSSLPDRSQGLSQKSSALPPLQPQLLPVPPLGDTSSVAVATKQDPVLVEPQPPHTQELVGGLHALSLHDHEGTLVHGSHASDQIGQSPLQTRGQANTSYVGTEGSS